MSDGRFRMRFGSALRRSAAALAVVAGAAASFADNPQTIARRFTPVDRERDRYVYVPFDVPAGTAQLRVRYEYDRANGENTIDLGIFEPGSLEIGTAAMRGYSGGSRSEVVIGEHDATPGYKPGPIPSGRWHVMLGLYRVAATGVDVTMTVHSLPHAAVPDDGRASKPRSGPPARSARRGTPGGARWWSGALHAHTVHSDGAVSAVDLLTRIRDARLDFVAVTDHNNTTHRAEVLRHGVPATPLWIVGEEVTTPAGHANVWGLDPGEWIDFRVRPKDRRVGELVGAAHAYGALFSINHPAGECAGCSWEHEVPDALDALEVWNGRHGADDKAVALWERLLRDGRRITAVGASDWHRDPDPIDSANVRVFAQDLSERAILDSIRAGRVIVMRSSSHPTPTFTVRLDGRSAAAGDTLKTNGTSAAIEVLTPGLPSGTAVIVVNGRRLPSEPVGDRQPVRLERILEPGYVRAEVYAADGALVAFTNPVYVTR